MCGYDKNALYTVHMYSIYTLAHLQDPYILLLGYIQNILCKIFRNEFRAFHIPI